MFLKDVKFQLIGCDCGVVGYKLNLEDRDSNFPSLTQVWLPDTKLLYST